VHTFLALALGASLAVTPKDAPEAIQVYRDVKRPLVLFAPSVDDPSLKDELERLAAAETAWRERDVVVVTCIGDFPNLRAWLHVPANHFTAVLVGKDGGTKWQTDRAFPVEDVTSRIDRMPMGQAEAKARRKTSVWSR
jgi:hypothetical protein